MCIRDRAGQTYSELVQYKDYFPEGEKYAALAAIVDGVYNKEYLGCIGGSAQSQESPDAFFKDAANTARDNSVAWSLSTKNNDPTPYTAEYTYDAENAKLGNPTSSTESTFTIDLNYADNGDQTSVGKERTENHWQGIGTAKDFYKSELSGKISVEDGHWVLFVSSQHYLESSRPMQ
jgi:hypothetical protein